MADARDAGVKWVMWLKLAVLKLVVGVGGQTYARMASPSCVPSVRGAYYLLERSVCVNDEDIGENVDDDVRRWDAVRACVWQ